MLVTLTEIAKGPTGSSLPPISLEFQTGSVTFAAAETERRPTILGLISSGRMKPDTGTVVIDGEADAAALRRHVALVDAPDVSDPAPDLTVGDVVAEELMFAGRPANTRAARKALAGLGLEAYTRTPVVELPARARIRLLAELATMRPDVRGLVITAPDRHGGDPREWWATAQQLAERGYAVLVIAGMASARVIAPNPFPTPDGGDAE